MNLGMFQRQATMNLVMHQCQSTANPVISAPLDGKSRHPRYLTEKADICATWRRKPTSAPLDGKSRHLHHLTEKADISATWRRKPTSAPIDGECGQMWLPLLLFTAQTGQEPVQVAGKDHLVPRKIVTTKNLLSKYKMYVLILKLH